MNLMMRSLYKIGRKKKVNDHISDKIWFWYMTQARPALGLVRNCEGLNKRGPFF